MGNLLGLENVMVRAAAANISLKYQSCNSNCKKEYYTECYPECFPLEMSVFLLAMNDNDGWQTIPMC